MQIPEYRNLLEDFEKTQASATQHQACMLTHKPSVAEA
jgi:hypothetical protein